MSEEHTLSSHMVYTSFNHLHYFSLHTGRFRHWNCMPFGVNAPKLWSQLAELLAQVCGTHHEGLKLFYSQTVDIYSIIWCVLGKHKAKQKFWWPFAKWNACFLHASARFYARLWNMVLQADVAQRGDRFSDDRSRFRCSWEWVDKDQVEKRAKKDGTVASTVRYGDWTPPLYAQITFSNSNAWWLYTISMCM